MEPKSATVLIRYLLDQSVYYRWKLTVVDADLSLAQSKINGHNNGTPLSFNISDARERAKAIHDADIVISMLPPALHYLVAQDCVAYGKTCLRHLTWMNRCVNWKVKSTERACSFFVKWGSTRVSII
ncbi:saccharopine dehydrogenase NADP-binding domain-containing protein [Niabella sp. W65]|nr:saccharopine dehydrogenase NADP-binding domain-containing protein [Niabella sp. W65]MCH7364992.1 saccharopine dehydrogenase NADP-binding domain-containing protein [Niabella sp. W65]